MMIHIGPEKIRLDEMISRSKRPDVGAIVTFLGCVRDDGIEGMEVESYEEMAQDELSKIEREALSRFDIRSVDIVHRVGRLSIGDDIVAIVCAASHRKAAFDGCSFVIDELKLRSAIWKKELLKDGGRWIP